MAIVVKRGNSIFVEGPARIEIKEGTGIVFGREVYPGDTIVVKRAKAVGIAALDRDLTVDIVSGVEPRYEIIEGSLFPDDWFHAADVISELEKPAIVAVLGDVDTGKSTLVTFLANILFKRGFKVAIVDEDVGQSDIGPPCVIGLSFMDRQIFFLEELEFHDGYFVGSITPSGLLQRSIVGVRLLLDRALEEGAEVILINTTGWVYGRGARELKTLILRVLRVNCIIAIEKSRELEHLIAPFRRSGTLRILRVTSPPRIRERDRVDRKFLRETSFEKYLRDAKEVKLKLDDVGIVYGFLGTGRPATPEELSLIEKIVGVKVEYAEISRDAVVVITAERVKVDALMVSALKLHFNCQDVRVVHYGDFKGTLVGLSSSDGRFLGLGIISQFNPKSRELTILTPVKAEDIAIIEYGCVKVSPEGKEERIFHPWSV